MTYQEAKDKRRSLSHLIGTIDKKGFIINDIIIVPTDITKRDLFIQSFVLSRNSEISIMPYVNDDVHLWAIDTEHLEKANILFYDVLD